MTKDDRLSRAQIALDEARLGLAEQTSALEAIRTRSLGLLAVVGLVVGLRTGRPEHGWLVVLGFAVGGLVLALGYILRPRSFVVSVRPIMLIDDPGWQIEQTEFTEHLGRTHGDSFDKNDATLRALGWAFAGALFATVVIAAVLLLSPSQDTHHGRGGEHGKPAPAATT